MNHQTKPNLLRDLSIVHRYGKIYLTNQLQDMGIAHCSPPFLIHIGRDPGISQETLAHDFHIDKGMVAKTIKKMEEENYIQRIRDDKDKRKNRLYLTPCGEAQLPHILQAKSAFEAQALQGLSLKEQQEFLRLLTKVRENLLDALPKEDSHE